MACTVAELRDAAACLACSVSQHELLAIAVLLACAASEGDTIACDVQSLRDSASCLACSVSSDRELLAMLVDQLCTIAGGGGLSAILFGDGPPASNPDPNIQAPTRNSIYTDNLTGREYKWNADTSGPWQET